MAGSQATISDVTDLINTNLDTSTNGPIDKALDYAQELNQEYNSESNQTNTQTKNIERWGSIAHIRQHLERGVTEDSVGSSSAVYEGITLADAKSELRGWVERAGGDLAMLDHFSTITRDSDRHVTSTTD